MQEIGCFVSSWVSTAALGRKNLYFKTFWQNTILNGLCYLMFMQLHTKILRADFPVLTESGRYRDELTV